MLRLTDKTVQFLKSPPAAEAVPAAGVIFQWQTAGASGQVVNNYRDSAGVAYTDLDIENYNPNAVTAEKLGLGNVTNESKATMFASPTFTGTAAAAAISMSGDLSIGTAGKGTLLKEGANAKMGAVVLVAGTATVATTKVTANSRIILTAQVLGTVTAPKPLAVTARTAATSFVITSSDATDTSTVAWMIVEPA